MFTEADVWRYVTDAKNAAKPISTAGAILAIADGAVLRISNRNGNGENLLEKLLEEYSSRVWNEQAREEAADEVTPSATKTAPRGESAIHPRNKDGGRCESGPRLQKKV